MAVTLNKTNRAAIVEAIIRETFKKREDALRAAHPQLAQRAYEAIVPAEFIALVEKHPAEWFNRGSLIRFVIGKKLARFPLRPNSPTVELPGVRFFPASMVEEYHSPAVEIGSDSHADLYADVTAQIGAEEAFLAERTDARLQLKARVNSIRTLEKLIETAPELEPFIPAGVKAGVVRNLPAVQVSTLITSLMASGLEMAK